MITPFGVGDAVGVADGDGFEEALGFALGVELGDALALALGETLGDGLGLPDGVGVGDGDAVISGLGSGVKVGAPLGCGVPLRPKNFASPPPSSSPAKITSTMSGTIGIPPLGSCGESMRRRRR
jgi:hypothetical protein